MKFTLPGSIRSKKNSKIATIVGGVKKPRRAILLPSKAYSKWEQEVHAYLGSQRMPEPIEGDLHIQATIYYKGQQPDLSGCLESIGDALEGWVYRDDKQIKSWDGSRLCHDKSNPRTEVEVRPL